MMDTADKSCLLLAAPFNIPTDAWLVEDADEEIFLLYSRLQSSDTMVPKGIEANASELGSIDSRKRELLVQIEFGPGEGLGCTSVEDRIEHRQKKPGQLTVNDSVEIRLYQDITGLRSRNGDTGSVLWRASIRLARLLLSRLHFSINDLFLNSSALSTCHVIELGAGTGLLSIILAPFVCKYTATDVASLVPLIQKNQAHNISASYLPKVSAEELDWVQLRDASPYLRQKIVDAISSPTDPRVLPKKSPGKGKRKRASSSVLPESVCSRCLILAVDCIYNPALIMPLLETMNDLASQMDLTLEHPTTVLIVLELRSQEVSHEFIHNWISWQGGWHIWNVPLLGPKYVMWIGQRKKGSQ